MAVKSAVNTVILTVICNINRGKHIHCSQNVSWFLSAQPVRFPPEEAMQPETAVPENPLVYGYMSKCPGAVRTRYVSRSLP